MEQNITKNPSFVMPIKDLEDNNYGYEQLEYLRLLGAQFIETHYDAHDKHFVTVILPEGFYVGDSYPSNNFLYRNIYDSNENVRGSFFVKQKDLQFNSKNIVANLVMNRRYRVANKFKTSGENRFKVIYFGNENEELFVQGVVPLNARHNSIVNITDLTKKLTYECKARADIEYPDNEDPLAYWDEAPVKDKGSVLSLTKKED